MSQNKSEEENRRLSYYQMLPEKLEKITRRVIAPYAQIRRRGLVQEEPCEKGTYLDINRFEVFLEDHIDLDSLLYETAMVLKTVTNSSGAFVYIVNKGNNEIVLMPRHTKNPDRHEVNIPIGEGETAAAHAAATKHYILIDDVERDRRFTEGLKWVDAKVALSMPIVKPDGECHAVVELYKTFNEPYDDNTVYTVVSVACWAGAAVHQAQARLSLQKSGHLNTELLNLLQKYFSDHASFDTMVSDMLAIAKTFLGAMRSSFYMVDVDPVNDNLIADMWDDAWSSDQPSMPRKKIKINMTLEQSPAALVARTGVPLNVFDVFKDPRFHKEIDPTTGAIVRSSLIYPILAKQRVIGVVQVINKNNAKPFTDDDEKIFKVFVGFCAMIVHYNNMQKKKIYHENLNRIYSELMCMHLGPCKHEFEEIAENSGVVLPPANFKSYDFHICESREDLPGLTGYMFVELFAEDFDRRRLADFIYTVYNCYRPNPYHNAEHAFTFAHTMYMIITSNREKFDFVETAALMFGAICHDIDHPGLNNNFLALIKHPLSLMYNYSTLEYHHYFLAKKLIEDKKLLAYIPEEQHQRFLDEMKYNILSTDLAIYFQTRAKLSPVIADNAFDWNNPFHKKMFKGILMTTSDLSGTCKPFGVSKQTALAVYEEFYDQGDKEAALGYTPLSMMDRRRVLNQPAEQIQFLSVVVLPCLHLLQNLLPNTQQLISNCRKTQDAWREEIEIRGLKLWKQEESIPQDNKEPSKQSSINTKTEEGKAACN